MFRYSPNREKTINILRVTLGVVFLWFGLLKIFDVSPVREMIEATYSFMPQSGFLFVLGVWEMLIGLGLLTRRCLRATLALLWVQMLGTFTAPFLNWSMFFQQSNPLLLTTEGEFVIKNLVLVAASIVIAVHEVLPSPRGSQKL